MTGIVRKIGWAEDDEGKPVFRAVVEYPDGPDELDDVPLRIVWDRLPVRIVVLDEKSTP
jgi:hypothetical protein